jgi:hypothetical protein
VRSYVRLLQTHRPENADNERLMQEYLGYLSRLSKNALAPEVTGYMQDVIKDVLHVDDLYADEKVYANNLLLAKYDELKYIVSHSNNPFETALKLSVAGNIIDYAANPDFDVLETIEYVLNNDFAIDDSKRLQDELKSAKNILYLADNAGEIVLDKLFIEQIGRTDMVFAVRGAPVINDATIEDAKSIGLNSVVKVIENGSSLPSTVLHTCSKEFKTYFDIADLILSKGQGNLEGLIDSFDKNIYFLAMIKCDAIGERLGTTKGSFVAMNNSRIKISLYNK